MIKSKLKKIWRRFFTWHNLFNILWLVLLIYILGNLFALNRSIEVMAGKQNSLVSEIGSQKEFRLRQEEDVKDFAQDLNQIRSYLLLPEREYNLFQKEVPLSPEEENNLTKALLLYFDQLGAEEESTKLKELKSSFIDDYSRNDLFNSYLLEFTINYVKEVVENAVYLKILDENKKLLITFSLPLKQSEIIIITPFNEVVLPYESEQDLFDLINNFLQTKTTSIKEYLLDFENVRKNLEESVKLEQIQKLLIEKQFTLGMEYQEGGDRYFYNLHNKNEEIVGQISIGKLDLKFGIPKAGSLEMVWTDYKDEFIKMLEEYLNRLNPLSQEEQRIDAKKEELMSLLKEAAIQDTLREKGLSISSEPIAQNDRFYFEIKNESGEILQKIAFDKGTGEINIVNSDGTAPVNIFNFNQDEKKKP